MSSITLQNHPQSTEDLYFGGQDFHPSYVGKTWGMMKQMEANRTCNDFFRSADLDENLQTRYSCFEQEDNYHSGLTALELLPIEQHTLKLNYCANPIQIPPSFAQRHQLTALTVHTTTLPVMPHIQILEWTPTALNPECDFSQWTSLRILRIHMVKGTPRIHLPLNLISFSLHKEVLSAPITNETFEDVFEDVAHHINVFQSLKNITLISVTWPTLPVLLNCRFFKMSSCSNLQTVEVPQCRSFTSHHCKSFTGFGSETLIHNTSLHAIILTCQRCEQPIHLPPGEPTGFRHVDISDSNVASLPTRFNPHAFISISDAGSHLFLSQSVRENAAFFFNHAWLQMLWDETLTLGNHQIPRQGESLNSMIDRVYGFNWSKFAIKIQRQYRFKKYLQHLHQSILEVVPHQDVCIYTIAPYLGALNTFKYYTTSISSKSAALACSVSASSLASDSTYSDPAAATSSVSAFSASSTPAAASSGSLDEPIPKRQRIV